jgi:hypothetical protein
MDIMANYYSVKDRVMRRLNPPSDWKVFSYKAKPANEGQRIRVNEMRRQDTIEQHERLIRRLNHEVEHLKQQVMSMSNSGMNETGEIVLTQDVPMPTYDNYEEIIDRLKGDIIEGIRSHSLDSFRTIEKDRVYFYIKAACDNLDAELTQILAGREQQLADEYSDEFEFVENIDQLNKDC